MKGILQIARGATLAIALGIVVAIGMLACGRADTRVLGVDSISVAQSVMRGGQDSLDPLPPNQSPMLSVNDVVVVLRAHPSDARYLTDPSQLHVRLGLYTNLHLIGQDGRPIQNVIAYVFSGGQARCAPASVPATRGRVATPAPTAPSICYGTIVANADTGQPILLLEDGIGG